MKARKSPKKQAAKPPGKSSRKPPLKSKSGAERKKLSQGGLTMPKDLVIPAIPFPEKINQNFKVDEFTKQLKTSQANLVGKLNGVSLVKKDGASDYKVRVIVLPGEEQAMRDALAAQNIPTANIEIVTSNKFELFNTNPILAKGLRGSDVISTGTCGPVVMNGGNTSVYTAGHVLSANKLVVAESGSLQSVVGGKVYENATLDLGIANVNTTSIMSGPNYKTGFAPPGRLRTGVDVYFIGGASEEQWGRIISANATATFGDVTYNNLIELEILAQHGDSGAAVVNDKHKIVGLIIGGDAANRRVYCSNLAKYKDLIPAQYHRDLYLYNKSNADGRRVYIPPPEYARREVELWLHKGTLEKAATETTVGVIKTSSVGLGERKEDIKVYTHYRHSFEKKDGGKGLVGQQVYFFAVPLEYILDPATHGIGLSSCLLAVNVTDKKQMLINEQAYYKFTPCGTGSTVDPDPAPPRPTPLAAAVIAEPQVYASAKTRPAVMSSTRKRAKARKGSQVSKKAWRNYVINDYGHLILVRSEGDPIAPWTKIVAKGDIRFRQPKGRGSIETDRLTYGKYDLDSWIWVSEV